MSSQQPSEPSASAALGRHLRPEVSEEDAADAARFAATKRAERPGVVLRGEVTEITSPLLTAIQDPESLLRQHNMDPAEWEILEAKLGRWDAMAKAPSGGFIHTDMHQLRLRVKPKQAPLWVVPASETSPVVRPKPSIPSKGKTRLSLVTTDLQVPFHDPRLHELTLRLAEQIEPDEWDDLGDVLDLPMLSRHRKKPEFHATFQESVNAGGRIFAERSQAMKPGAKKRVLWGNHDSRLRNWLLDHAPELFGVTRAQIGFEDDEQAVMDLDFLLRLDQSGWEKARSPWGEYPYETIWLAPGLAGVHGEHVRKGAGNSVREEIRERTHSVAQGHVNKLACYAYTRTDIQGRHTVFGIEGGMMCLSEGSLGFGGQTVDWTPGLFTVTTYEDGSFNVDLAPYVNGSLRYRGLRLWHDGARGVKVAA